MAKDTTPAATINVQQCSNPKATQRDDGTIRNPHVYKVLTTKQTVAVAIGETLSQDDLVRFMTFGKYTVNVK